MEKDFLKKYENEIRLIANKLIDSSKRWKLSRISEVWKDIFDEVCKCNIDMSVCSNSGYLPVHISSTYLREEDTYENLLLIFKLHTSEVLFLLTSSENSAIDISKTNDFINKLSTKNKLKEFFSEFTQHNVDMLTLLNVTEEISKNINILESRLRKADIDNLNTLFNIITEKEMLTLFGYYLYVYFYKKYLLFPKYYSIINLVYDARKMNVTQARAICSFLYSTIFAENEISSKNILTYKDISDKKMILSKFKEADKFEYAYDSENNLGTFIIIDCSESSTRKNINNVLHIYSKKVKKQYLNTSIIIISKKKITDDIVLHVNFENLNSDKYLSVKKKVVVFQEYISEFEDFINTKYDQLRLDLTEFTMKPPVKKVSKSIYNSAVIEKHLANKYAPILLALYDFFEFLRNKYYISQEDYDKFMNLCKTIYGAENTQIDISNTNTNVDPIVVFTKTIYELYINNIELFAEDNTKQPFRYTKTKNKKELICFKNISDVISFVKNNKNMIASYNDFSNIFIESKSDEDVLQQIKDFLFEKQIQKTNKDRKDYKIDGKLYFALDVAKLKEFIAQCE